MSRLAARRNNAPVLLLAVAPNGDYTGEAEKLEDPLGTLALLDAGLERLQDGLEKCLDVESRRQRRNTQVLRQRIRRVMEIYGRACEEHYQQMVLGMVVRTSSVRDAIRMTGKLREEACQSEDASAED
jgi:hypothetical protein